MRQGSGELGFQDRKLRDGELTWDDTRDLLALNWAGVTWLYPGDSKGGVTEPRKFGTGWDVMTSVIAVGNFMKPIPPVPPTVVANAAVGEPSSYLLSRDDSGGLTLYPGNGRGGVLLAVQAGSGWGSMTALVSVGDMTGSG